MGKKISYDDMRFAPISKKTKVYITTSPTLKKDISLTRGEPFVYHSRVVPEYPRNRYRDNLENYIEYCYHGLGIPTNQIKKHRFYTTSVPLSSFKKAEKRAVRNAEDRIDYARRNHEPIPTGIFVEERDRELAKLARHTRIKRKSNKGRTSLRR